MAQALTKFKLSLVVDALQTNAGDLSSATDPLSYTKRYSFTHGIIADKSEIFWSDSRNLAATTADNIDAAGVLVSSLGLGATITFTRVKALIVVHKTPAASAALQVGGHATLGLLFMGSVEGLDTDQPHVFVRPGGMIALVAPDAAGYPVTAGADDMIRIYNGAAAAIDYDIIILGTTTA